MDVDFGDMSVEEILEWVLDGDGENPPTMPKVTDAYRALNPHKPFPSTIDILIWLRDALRGERKMRERVLADAASVGGWPEPEESESLWRYIMKWFVLRPQTRDKSPIKYGASVRCPFGVGFVDSLELQPDCSWLVGVLTSPEERHYCHEGSLLSAKTVDSRGDVLEAGDVVRDVDDPADARPVMVIDLYPEESGLDVESGRILALGAEGTQVAMRPCKLVRAKDSHELLEQDRRLMVRYFASGHPEEHMEKMLDALLARAAKLEGAGE